MTAVMTLGLKGHHELGRLTRAPSAPLKAYVRGNPELLHRRPAVGIVGTRKPSEIGGKRAFEYAASLSRAGCLVVSGGAIGIDYAAHQGALSVGEETLVILGEPVSYTRDERPHRIRQLDPLEKVTTVTVFGPETKIGKTLFVARNQYIAALSDAILIIEGTLNSGTLHTARYAQKMGVPVWAIPGDPENPLAEAANFLLSNGQARPLLNLEAVMNTLEGCQKNDISRQIVIPGLIRDPVFIQDSGPRLSGLGDNDSLLEETFRASQGRVTLDLLAQKLSLPIPQIQSDLLELELMGTIRREGAEFVWQNHWSL